jgi:hypothetical protein
MERPAKKMRFSEELLSDPTVILNEDSFEHILQFLTGKDILSTFLVSKRWNQIASSSLPAMSLIKFRFREQSATNPSSVEINELLKSKRKYRNFDGQFKHLANGGLKLSLLKHFARSIVDLKIAITKRRLLSQFLPDLSFPNLKSLDWEGNMPTEFCRKALKDSKKIEKLSIQTTSNSFDLLNELMDKSKLKELKLIGDRYLFFGNDSFQMPKYKLTSFSQQGNEFSLTVEQQTRKNFDNFVIQMAKTLTSLAIDTRLRDDMKLALLHLPNLKHLNIFDFQRFHAEPNEINKISSCLKVLECQYINEKDFKWIVRNIKGLKRINIEFWGRKERIDDYKNAKKEKIEKCYNKLKAAEPTINGELEICVEY